MYADPTLRDGHKDGEKEGREMERAKENKGYARISFVIVSTYDLLEKSHHPITVHSIRLDPPNRFPAHCAASRPLKIGNNVLSAAAKNTAYY